MNHEDRSQGLQNHLGDLVVGGSEKMGEEATGTTLLDTMFVLPYSFPWKSNYFATF